MKIVIVGSGNVALQLGLALKQAGHRIESVISRNVVKGKKAGLILKTSSSASFKEIPSCDIILIAVSDNAIASVAKKIPVSNAIVLHTSGSVAMKVFGKRFKKYGVMYPVQTISTNDYVDFGEVPFCVEGSDKTTRDKITRLASTISENVLVLNSAKRKVLHLSAVIANNFTNHLFSLAEDVLKKNKIPFSLLRPLIEQTAKKIKMGSPSLAQTGPAKRGDKKIIKEHLKMLSYNKNLRAVYALLSASIENKK